MYIRIFFLTGKLKIVENNSIYLCQIRTIENNSHSCTYTLYCAKQYWMRMRANTCTETYELVRKMPNVESRQQERPLNPHLNSCLTTIIWTLKFLARDDNFFTRMLSPSYLCYHYRLSSPIILIFFSLL